MTLLSGLSGGVLVGGTTYPFKKWSGTITTKAITRNNWTVQGFQRLVAGFTDGHFDLEAPYDAGNMPITCGQQYVFTYQWTAALALVVTCQVETLSPDDDAEDAPNIKIGVKSTGVFTAAIT